MLWLTSSEHWAIQTRLRAAIRGPPHFLALCNLNGFSYDFTHSSSDNDLLRAIFEGINRINDSLKRDTAPSQDSQETFWSTYLKEAKEHDDELMEKYKNDMDISILFVSKIRLALCSLKSSHMILQSTLFSAVVAAFVVDMQPALSPNPSDTTNALLMILIHTIDNSTFPDQPSEIPQWNGPSYTAVCSLTLAYLSLSLGLLAAIGTVVGKQWLSRFSRLGEGTNEVRGRRRQQKLDCLTAWQFDIAMKVLPALLHLALALFAVALSFNLWGANQTVAWVFISVTAFGGLVYVAITVLSIGFPSCPYQTPFSTVTRWMIVTIVDTAQEFTYYLRKQDSEPMIHPLAGLLILLPLPLFGWGTIFLTLILVTVISTVVWWSSTQAPFSRDKAIQRLELLLSWLKDRLQPTLQQYPEFRSIAWILETSYHLDVIMAAVERIPDAVAQTRSGLRRGQEYGVEEQNSGAQRQLDGGVENQAFHADEHNHIGGQDHDGEEQASFDFFPLTKHLCDLFVDSVVVMNKRFTASQQDRATALGKALVGLLSHWNFNLAVHQRFWNEARQKFERFQARSMASDSTTYLLQLLIELLPTEDNVGHTNHFELEATCIPKQLLFWSLPFLRNALQRRQNPCLLRLFSTVPPVLERVCFSVEPTQRPSEYSSYFCACQAYLGMLCQGDKSHE